MTQTRPPSSLDALLARSLRPGGLTPEQRQRHLRRMGLVVAEDVARDAVLMPSMRHSIQIPGGGQPVDNSSVRQTRGRQWLELAAAVLAIVVVGGLLAIVFRGTGDDPESRSGVAGSPIPTVPNIERSELAFVANRDGNDDIYLYAVASGETLRLTSDPASDGSPVWSPDGERIAFTRGAEDTRDIFVMNADGSDQRNITGMPGDETNAAWSPDGESLVFTYRQGPPEFDSEVYVVGLDGSVPRNLTNAPQSMDQAGPWSPDGSRILYSRTGPEGMELAVMAADGSGKRTLATGGMAIFPGTWSPDGSLIGFSRLNEFWQGYVMNADGTNERLLIEGLGSHGPSWSPDGSRMVVVGREGDDLFLLDGDGTNARAVEPPNGTGQNPSYQGIEWSPDGAWLYAFVASGSDGTSDLVAIPADGTAWTTLKTGIPLPTSAQVVAWRPDAPVVAEQERPDVLDEADEPDVDTGDQQSLLFVASHVSIDRGSSVSTIGRVRAYDAETGEERYAFAAGPRIDMALAPDGERLFVAGSAIETGRDDLVAHDPATGRELWRVAVEDRAWWKFGEGESALAVSPDGRELYVYSCSACTGELRMGNGGDHWLQVFDAASGEKLRDVPVPTCAENRDIGVQLHLSPDGDTLFVVCLETGRVSAVDLTGGSVREDLPGIGARIAGSAMTPDGRELFVLTFSDGMYSVVVIDTASGTVDRQGTVLNAGETTRLLPLVAVSTDGAQLIIGIDDRPDDTEASARTLYTFDTETLRPGVEIELDTAIDVQPPVAGGDASSLFALGRETTPDNTFQQTILRMAPNGVQDTIAVLDREEVIVMRAGTVLAAR